MDPSNGKNSGGGWPFKSSSTKGPDANARKETKYTIKLKIVEENGKTHAEDIRYSVGDCPYNVRGYKSIQGIDSVNVSKPSLDKPPTIIPQNDNSMGSESEIIVDDNVSESIEKEPVIDPATQTLPTIPKNDNSMGSEPEIIVGDDRNPVSAEESIINPTQQIDPKCRSKNLQPTDCQDRKDYKRQARIFHPNSNYNCKDEATEKFQKLTNYEGCLPFTENYSGTYDDPENPVQENTVQENPVPENPVPENPVQENPVQENTVPENPVPQISFDQTSVPRTPFPRTVPRTYFPDYVPKNTVPQTSVPKNTVPLISFPQTSKQPLSSKEMVENKNPLSDDVIRNLENLNPSDFKNVRSSYRIGGKKKRTIKKSKGGKSKTKNKRSTKSKKSKISKKSSTKRNHSKK